MSFTGPLKNALPGVPFDASTSVDSWRVYVSSPKNTGRPAGYSIRTIAKTIRSGLKSTFLPPAPNTLRVSPATCLFDKGDFANDSKGLKTWDRVAQLERALGFE